MEPPPAATAFGTGDGWPYNDGGEALPALPTPSGLPALPFKSACVNRMDSVPWALMNASLAAPTPDVGLSDTRPEVGDVRGSTKSSRGGTWDCPSARVPRCCRLRCR